MYFNVNFNVFFKLKTAFVGKRTLHFSVMLILNKMQIKFFIFSFGIIFGVHQLGKMVLTLINEGMQNCKERD